MIQEQKIDLKAFLPRQHSLIIFISKRLKCISCLSCLFLFTSLPIQAEKTPSQNAVTATVYADKIFQNGHIITVDENNPTAKAIAVYQGKILAVGNKEDVFSYIGSDTDIVDLDGKTLLPGFIDIHTHPILSAMMAETADISGFNHQSQDEVIASIKAAVAAKNKGEWVIAYGWDPAILRDLQQPSLAQLDQWAPDNPLFIISQTLHSAFANSIALEKAGVDKNTPDPSGGYFEKDANGELTGFIVEVNAMAKFTKATPKFPKSAYIYLLTKQFERYAKAGYTTIVAPGLQAMFPQALDSFRQVAEHVDSPVRTFVYPTHDNFKQQSSPPKKANLQFKVLGPKLWIDGSPYAGGMAMNQPYLDNDFTKNKLGIATGSKGHLNFTNRALIEVVERYHRQGWQISAHIQGERAAKQFLDAVAAAQTAFPRKDPRHRMEHNALVTYAQFQRAYSLGVTPSFYIDHIYYYGDALTELIVGPQRAERYMALNSAKKAGHHVSLHTDTPSSPLGALRAMQVAVTRTTRSEQYQLGPQEAISVEDAIKAVTINAAWQIFEENSRGSIEIGKLADFTVLSDNLMTTPVSDWSDIKVLNTYVAGELVESDTWSWRKLSLLSKTAWGLLFN